MSDRLNRVIPRPFEAKLTEGSFAWNGDIIILLEPGNEQDRLAAETLMEACKQRNLALPKIVESQDMELAQQDNIVFVGDPSRFWPLGSIMRSAGNKELERVGDQGYFIEVKPSRIIVAANAPAGVYYGVQTLIQLIPEKEEADVPCVEITDWTNVRQRGISIDYFAGEVYKTDWLKETIRRLAHYKMNALVLYLEDGFYYPSHPDLAEGRDTLTPDEAKEVDAFALRHHVEIMPLYNSPAHMRHTLAHPNYKHMAEGTASGPDRIINVTHPETYLFLENMYEDLCKTFSSPFIYMGGDEAFAFGTGGSKPVADKIGKTNLYIGHLKRIREVAARYGKRIVVYGDPFEPGFFKNYGLGNYGIEGLSRVPRDVVIAPWHYGKMEVFPFGEKLNEMGFDQHLWSSNGAYLKLFPDIEASARNAGTYIPIAHPLKALGAIHSDWNEPGENTFSELNWPNDLFFAECAWSESARPFEEGLSIAVESFYGPGTASLAEVLRFLSHPRKYFGWGGQAFIDPARFLFFMPLKPHRLGQFINPWKDKEGNEHTGIPLEDAQKNLTEFRRECSEAKRVLEQTKTIAVRNKEHLDFVEFIIQQFEVMAELVECRHILSLPESDRDTQQTPNALKDLDAKFSQLYSRYRELWLRVNKPMGLKPNLEKWDKVRESISAIRNSIK